MLTILLAENFWVKVVVLSILGFVLMSNKEEQ
jgi:hypothetical protein